MIESQTLETVRVEANDIGETHRIIVHGNVGRVVDDRRDASFGLDELL